MDSPSPLAGVGGPDRPALLRPGVHLTDEGALFTVFSRQAERLWLLLFDDPRDPHPAREVELRREEHRIGDVWHVYVPGVRAGMGYVYRAAGPALRHDARQWLLDPCALAVEEGRGWGEPGALTPGQWPRDGAGFPRGVVTDDRLDGEADFVPAPGRPWNETVIYEAHVRGFTAHASSGVRNPGTYLGFIEKIPYLKSLGVTAVEFLPLQEFNEMEFFVENGARKALRNFWGYSTRAFFAPMPRYASEPSGLAPLREFRSLVRALHRAGIEVILDVVFNHTAELDAHGPVYSFKGLDLPAYYLLRANGAFENFTGCGNTVNANHPVVREFIVDCLRYWVVHFGVDGFRFDLASALTRGEDGKPMPRPPLLDRIADDPHLKHVKLIAEAWDAAGLYQVGRFPHPRWAEWNGMFRDEVRRFWTGAGSTLGKLATRLAGSSDLYTAHGRGPLNSVNYVAIHDGFTLADLVAYQKKHNADNGEDNRDGEVHNYSSNHGVEGPTDDPAIRALRLRQQKNLLATVFLSQGVPMIAAGDEFGRTQRGNNNAYGQDNEISWVDWSSAGSCAELTEFVRRLIAFRSRFASLRRTRFLTGHPAAPALPPDVQWWGPDGRAPPNWVQGHALLCMLDGHAASTGAPLDEPSLLIAVNGAHQPCPMRLPAAPDGFWRGAWSTADNPPERCAGGVEWTAPALSITVFSGAGA